MYLMGGDTTRHANVGGPLVISITMVGKPLGEGPVLRSGARVGDQLVVTGSIGDGGLALRALREGTIGVVTRPYHRPNVPFKLAKAISTHARASLDVSDGLLADAAHLAKASDVGIRIDGRSVPLSGDGEALVSNCLLYTSPSPRDQRGSRMPSSA